MPRVEATIDIPAPPVDVFEFVADQHRRRLLLPDNFRDFRVLSDAARGEGTRVTFTIVTGQGAAYPMRVEIRDWNPPYGFTEQDLDNQAALHWSFQPEGDGTRVTVVSEYAIQGTVFHRLVERWFARKALQASLMVELTRLKRLVGGE